MTTNTKSPSHRIRTALLGLSMAAALAAPGVMASTSSSPAAAPSAPAFARLAGNHSEAGVRVRK